MTSFLFRLLYSIVGKLVKHCSKLIYSKVRLHSSEIRERHDTNGGPKSYTTELASSFKSIALFLFVFLLDRNCGFIVSIYY